MPASSRTIHAGGSIYGNPFVGDVEHTATVMLDISTLTTDEVDADGYIKPGLLLSVDGDLIGVGVTAFGAVIEATKVADDNTDLANGVDRMIAVATICQLNRAIVEDNLGRVLSADEIASVEGTPIVLIPAT